MLLSTAGDSSWEVNKMKVDGELSTFLFMLMLTVVIKKPKTNRPFKRAQC